MNEKLMLRIPDLLRRLVGDYLAANKKIKELERQLEKVKAEDWRNVKILSPKEDPNANPFWATVKSGALSRVVLVAYFDDLGFCETNDIYAETFIEQISLECITHWMPINRPLYPSKQTNP